MQRVVKKIMMVMAVVIVSGAASGSVAEAVTKNVLLDTRGNKVVYRRPGILDRAEKVKVKSSRKSVVTAKYLTNRKDRRIALHWKKKGNAVVTVKCWLKNRKKTVIRYKIKVAEKPRSTNLDMVKKAFDIQNQYRRENGVPALEWSDELYRFCLYRLKKSGFDGHKNLDRDREEYFRGYTETNGILFGENLARGYGSAKSVMRGWKKSPGHCRNIMADRYGSGAIAYYKGIWCAIFMDADAPALDNWQDSSLKKVTVKRYDSVSGTYVSGSTIRYYEADDKWNTMRVIRLGKSSEKSVYLEVGKTYIFYEQVRPDGCEKAENVTITVTEDGAGEIVLSS